MAGRHDRSDRERIQRLVQRDGQERAQAEKQGRADLFGFGHHIGRQCDAIEQRVDRHPDGDAQPIHRSAAHPVAMCMFVAVRMIVRMCIQCSCSWSGEPRPTRSSGIGSCW